MVIDENVVVGAYDRILHYSLKYVLYIGEKIKVEERVDGMDWIGSSKHRFSPFYPTCNNLLNKVMNEDYDYHNNIDTYVSSLCLSRTQCL